MNQQVAKHWNNPNSKQCPNNVRKEIKKRKANGEGKP